MAKAGLDGHDRGAKVIARALMDAGFEVVYLGVHQSVRTIVDSAADEDVSVIALSVLSGAHMELAADLLKEMKKRGLTRPVLMGGIISDEDAARLKKAGVFAVFGPGSPLERIVAAVGEAARRGGAR